MNFQLQVENAGDYLNTRCIKAFSVRELSGGVSSMVLWADTSVGRIVMKQALPELRVRDHWACDRGRIWREAGVLQDLAPIFPQGSLPEVLFRDDPNYIYAMSAAAERSQSWKSLLLSGVCEPSVAERVAELTAALLNATDRNSALAQRYSDLAIFRDLRLLPYYETTALRNPEVAPQLRRLIDLYPERCRALVHGDWSPKNLLVCDNRVMAIDFEAVHFGDPAFDAAFILNHLILKSFHMPAKREEFQGLAEVFWNELDRRSGTNPILERHTIEHLGALLLARIDGKSPVEYISDQTLRDRIRRVAIQLIIKPPVTIREVIARCV